MSAAWHPFVGSGLWCEMPGCRRTRVDAVHMDPKATKTEIRERHVYVANPACCSFPVDDDVHIETRYAHAPGAHTIEEAFDEFHRANPHVYEELVKLARHAKQRGFAHYGIGALYEVFRWERGPTTKDDDGYAVNNNYRAIYARRIMAECPDLAGFFTTRARRSEDEPETD